MNMDRIIVIEKELNPLRKRLREHELYSSLNDINDVRFFMEEHVYAVWDFMSLLKALQQRLTCIQTPWVPVVNPKTARFINEIVLEEESDINELGEPRSHFEMYIDAMKETNADLAKISAFISEVIDGKDIKEILENSGLSEETKAFVDFTFEVIRTNEPHIIAASFTFGREDVIPDMFLEIVKRTEEEERVDYGKLKYYLNRHIELDGDEHGPLALQMIAELCGNDDQKWQDVLYYAKAALEKRIELWSGIHKKIESNKQKAVAY